MDNADVQSFTHHGNKSGTGTISFQDTSGQNIATIAMSRRRDGLWFTANAVLIPPSPTITKVKITHHICPVVGSDIQPILHQLAAPTHYSTAMKNLELWHQRMGHPSLRTLRRTQQVIDGIPRLPDAEAIFSCPFCDKAKLRKHHGKGPSTRETFLPGTSFHMDIGFIRGPKNQKKKLSAKALSPKKPLSPVTMATPATSSSLTLQRDMSGHSSSRNAAHPLHSSSNFSPNMDTRSKPTRSRHLPQVYLPAHAPSTKYAKIKDSQ